LENTYHSTPSHRKKTCGGIPTCSKKNKEPQKKKGKKDKATPSSSRTVSQHEKASKQAGPSSIVNKTFKSQESKGKTKLVEEN
jgi:hypothetical protein